MKYHSVCLASVLQEHILKVSYEKKIFGDSSYIEITRTLSSLVLDSLIEEDHTQSSNDTLAELETLFLIM